ncbi:flavin monoamine oxidase family protein [Nocardioides bizhenqiangii]|uniref:NAD(P)/FAD-dependent oxidoreductase n=1 Tax=Nocardioides bizhenqiangii TaxID=3095076 RepID=A0ABZ0ZPB8_9ACTN|nr:MULTISPECIES: NAD(P)/FAD-dependent oxidoreductase [unclassified Nocardioides]MDZ5619777.1 NAD(P)/FAD-dependent oxidoreductase [Nocardioides sp. HM23]WQQ26216.1 NAD(P)/FAD-dependent oxidoreductase [Nocardioides sp. HM61]
MRIGVVGAGLAGLACAWRMHRAGHEVIVLEARDRVGGRTWSPTLPNGVVVERGGEWIDADQHTIRRVCAELELPLAPHGVRFHRRRVTGDVLTLADLERTLETVAEQIPEEDTTVEAAFEAGIGEGYAGDPTFLRIATSTAGRPGTASARVQVARAAGARLDAAARVVGGNQRIASALASALGDRVRLTTPVTGIAVDDGHVVLSTERESLVVGRAVIAVPLPLLDDLAWEPGFPAAWQEGLTGLATGTAVKLSVPTTNRARPDGVQHPTHAWWAWNSLDPAGDAGVRAVSCFAGGPVARDLLEVADGPDTWVRHLTALRPDLDLVGGEALLTDWETDPWSRGGYSYVLAGRPPEAAAPLQRPAGPLVLAGEHTAGPYSGTMEGAIRSGLRAARTITG